MVNCALVLQGSSSRAHAERCFHSTRAVLGPAHASRRPPNGSIEWPRTFTRDIASRAELGLHSTVPDCTTRLNKVVNLQGTASPARVKWKAVTVG